MTEDDLKKLNDDFDLQIYYYNWIYSRQFGKCFFVFKVETMHNKQVIEKLQNGRTTNEFERQMNGVFSPVCCH